MRHLLIFYFLGFIYACQRPQEEKCGLTYNHISKEFRDRIKPEFRKDSIIEVSDLGDGTVYGGYYQFIHGELKSYRFFTKYRSANDTNNSADLVYTYVESYQKDGNFRSVIGIPLVYKIATRLGGDSIKVEAFLFSLNKLFEPINIKANTGYKAQVQIMDDTIFTNMKKAEFVFKIGDNKNIELEFQGRYIDQCFRDTSYFTDSLSLVLINNRLQMKTGG